MFKLSRDLVSAGHVGEILRLIERISSSEDGLLKLSALIESRTFTEVLLNSIIAKGVRYNWIQVDGDLLSIRDDPRTIEDEGRLDTKRRMLMCMIIDEKPKWNRFLRNGPTDSFIGRLTTNEKQLFREFGLLTNREVLSDENAEKWWYRAQNLGWDIENEIRADHGKIGEELSMELEEARTGLRPIWVSRRDSGAGFDIESVQAEDDHSKKLIEVKATTSRSVYVTRNEARVSEDNSENYFFHIWKLNMDDYRRSLLCIVTADEMMRNFPNNQGNGRWQNVEIPIRTFGDQRFECPFDE